VITPPDGFELSTTTGGSFVATNPITLIPSGGTVSETTIYARFAPVVIQTYTGNIAATSTGAASKYVAVSGTGVNGEPTNHATNFTASTTTETTIPLTWTDATGSVLPENYLIKGSSVGYGDIADPVDGTPESDGLLVKNVAFGVENYTFTGLAEGTTYYFKIYPYTNSGALIDYKIGSAPEATATTLGGASDKSLEVTVFLEGPFDGASMSTTLNTENLIPLTQPYNVDPWFYEGSEAVAAIPADVVDWVLVDLRDADAPENATSGTSLTDWPKAMFLKNDGSLVGLDGNAPSIGNPTVSNNLYIVIRHRNHLDVMSATELSLTGDVYSYDFSTGIDQAYGGGNGYKEISAGIYGMVTGDMDGDSDIGVNDFTLWATDFGNAPVYMNSDADMDSDVGVNDFTKWATNFGIANLIENNGLKPFTYKSQVPDIK
jgi:hypothetical protein